MDYKELEAFCWEVQGQINALRNELIKRENEAYKTYNDRGASIHKIQREYLDKASSMMWNTLYKHKGIK